MTIRAALLVLLLVVPINAAPPNLTHLYPAGAGRGTTVEVEAGGTFERWPVRAWIEGKGVEVKPGKGKGKLLVTVAADAAPGPRWLRLVDEQGSSVLRRFVVGTLAEQNEREPNDDYRRPHTLADSAVVVNGRLEKAGDVDCFAVRVRKGQTLVARVEAHRLLASPMDAIVQVVSPRGDVLAENNDHAGFDPQVVYRASEDQTCIVRVFAFPSVPDSGIRFAGGERFIYRLTITRGGCIEHAFPLAVPRARPGTVSLVGWNLGEAARAVPVVPRDEDDEAVITLPGVTGVASVRLEPHATVAHTGGKEVHELTLPTTVSGRIARSGDVHTYRFAATKGQRVTFEVESVRLGYAVDAVLRLSDATGKVLNQVRAMALGRDPELAFPVPADGSYRLEVSDLLAGAGPRHLYRLRARLAHPDFALSVAVDRFAVAPGKTVDIPVNVERQNGFTGTIELSAEGLPAGVTAETIQGGRGLTLRLRALDKATGGGPLRIIGRVKETTRIARAPLPEYSVTTPHLWLNVSTTPVPAPPPRRRR